MSSGSRQSRDDWAIVCPKTGEVTGVELFVCVLGASSYTYAEATYTQKSRDFIASHIRALEYFGGVPAGARSGRASCTCPAPPTSGAPASGIDDDTDR